MNNHNIKTAKVKNLLASFVARFADDESGATFLEYTLLVGLLGLAMLTFFGNTATSTQDNFNAIATQIDNS